MSEFLNNLTKSSFWLTVVLVGILINFASTWLQSLLSRYSEAFALRREAKTAKERADDVRMLELAKQSDRHFMLFVHHIASVRASADRALLCAVFLVAMFAAEAGIFLTIGRLAESEVSQWLRWGQAAIFALTATGAFMCLVSTSRRTLKASRLSSIAYDAVLRKHPSHPGSGASVSGAEAGQPSIEER